MSRNHFLGLVLVSAILAANFNALFTYLLPTNADATNTSKSVSINELNIVDSKGKVRIKLSVENDEAVIYLLDETNKKRLVLAASRNKPRVSVANEHEEELINMSYHEINGPFLSIRDYTRTERMLFQVKDLTAMMRVNDKDKKKAMTLKADEYYNVDLKLHHRDKKEDLQLTAYDGGMFVGIGGSLGAGNVSMGHRYDGTSRISMTDRMGRGIFLIKATKDSGPRLTMKSRGSQTSAIRFMSEDGSLAAMGIGKGRDAYLGMYKRGEQTLGFPKNLLPLKIKNEKELEKW